ncbi:MAG TPA: LysM peptidoglycan-binding domain-containing protein, partial [Albitalea sp.]
FGATGATLEQNAGLNGDARWVRPKVFQEFDRWGNLLSVSDPRSPAWKTVYRYNAFDQLVEERRPDEMGVQSEANPATHLYYDQLGRRVSIVDALGHANRSEYDAAGQLVREIHADGGIVEHRYDAFGNRVQTVDAVGVAARGDATLSAEERARTLDQHTTRFQYDKLARLTAKVHGTFLVASVDAGTNALNAPQWQALVERSTWDAAGRKLTQTNGAGELTRYRYDARGHVTATEQPLGIVTRAAFDAQGRKSAEVDANGHSATWRHDHFGRLTGHRDLGGAVYAYAYDHARQLVAQSNSRGQDLKFGYDAAGRLTRVDALVEHDAQYGVDIRQLTTYAYDHAGRRIRERTAQTTRLDDGRWVDAVYQDNHLGYDARGQLRDIADGRAHVSLAYDAAGNRTRVTTRVMNGDTVHQQDRWFAYDAMNRQTVVDAVDAAGNLGQQGQRIGYDLNGNRIREEAWGNRVVTAGGEPLIVGYDENGQALYATTPVSFEKEEGSSVEAYRYDGLNRLVSVVKDGVQLDLRRYDGAGRVVATGPSHLPQGYADKLAEGRPAGEVSGVEQRINRYDAAGRLVHQKVLQSDGQAKVDIDYTELDGVGNVRAYTLQSHAGGYINSYRIEQRRFEGYKEDRVEGTSTQFEPGSTQNRYDVNGNLVGVSDATKAENDRTFVNDLAGRALLVNQGGHVQRQLVVESEVLGRYGMALDEVQPRDGSGNPQFKEIADFSFGYRAIGPNYPTASPGSYVVQAGDTLQGIARAAYGDSALWYRIADANGLNGNPDLRVGQTLSLPSLVGTVHNNEGTFKPYDPSKVVGDTTPNLPVPASSDG